MSRYEVSFGTSPGDTDVRDFVSVPKGDLSYTATGLHLTTVRQVFATIRAWNEAGLNGSAVSNGVYVSRASAGLSPLGSSYAYDGNRANIDM